MDQSPEEVFSCLLILLFFSIFYFVGMNLRSTQRSDYKLLHKVNLQRQPPNRAANGQLPNYGRWKLLMREQRCNNNITINIYKGALQSRSQCTWYMDLKLTFTASVGGKSSTSGVHLLISFINLLINLIGTKSKHVGNLHAFNLMQS